MRSSRAAAAAAAALPPDAPRAALAPRPRAAGAPRARPALEPEGDRPRKHAAHPTHAPQNPRHAAAATSALTTGDREKSASKERRKKLASRVQKHPGLWPQPQRDDDDDDEAEPGKAGPSGAVGAGVGRGLSGARVGSAEGTAVGAVPLVVEKLNAGVGVGDVTYVSR